MITPNLKPLALWKSLLLTLAPAVTAYVALMDTSIILPMAAFCWGCRAEPLTCIPLGRMWRKLRPETLAAQRIGPA